MFGRNRKLRQEIERKNVQLESQQKRIGLLEANLRKTANDLEKAKEMIDSPPFYKRGQKIGPVTILEVFIVDEEISFGKAVGAGLLLVGAVAVGLAIGSVLSSSGRSQACGPWHYRFYDADSRSVKEMTEEEMNEFIEKKGW